MNEEMVYAILILSPVLAAVITRAIDHLIGVPRIQRDVTRLVKCLCKVDPKFRRAWHEELSKEWFKNRGVNNGKNDQNGEGP